MAWLVRRRRKSSHGTLRKADVQLCRRSRTRSTTMNHGVQSMQTSKVERLQMTRGKYKTKTKRLKFGTVINSARRVPVTRRQDLNRLLHLRSNRVPNLHLRHRIRKKKNPGHGRAIRISITLPEIFPIIIQNTIITLPGTSLMVILRNSRENLIKSLRTTATKFSRPILRGRTTILTINPMSLQNHILIHPSTNQSIERE